MDLGLESGGVYGYRKITDDLRDLGERCGKPAVVDVLPCLLHSPPLQSQNPLTPSGAACLVSTACSLQIPVMKIGSSCTG